MTLIWLSNTLAATRLGKNREWAARESSVGLF